MIYDGNDNFELGFIDYEPYLLSPNTDAPISPPQNVTISASPGGVKLSWDANLEGDIAGYKVYFSNHTGYSFTNSLDVGNVNQVNLNGLSLSDTIAVTAYDGDIDGTNDQTDGNESWFSYAKYVNETPTMS